MQNSKTGLVGAESLGLKTVEQGGTPGCQVIASLRPL